MGDVTPEDSMTHILTEQQACADHLIEHGPDRGAQLGLADWTAEEILERGDA